MSIEDDINFIETPTCVLKLNIHCNGCKKKVNKLLRQIEGVYQTDIDAEQGKVIVSGNVDPAILLKMLNKAGRHAELWESTDGNDDNLTNQLQKLQLEDGKWQQKDNGKRQKGVGGGGGGGKDQRGQQPAPQKEIKGLKDMKFPQLKGLKFPFRKNQKSVKFDLPPDSDVDEESGDDEESNDFDDEEDFDDMDSFDDGFDNDPNGNGMANDKKGGGGGGKNGGTANGGKKGGGKNEELRGVQPMGSLNMMGQGFQGMDLGGGIGNMQHGPMSYMGNIPAGAVPPGYLQGGMVAPEMIAAADNPYQQQYMAAMMEQQRMMMNGQGGGGTTAYPPTTAYGYGTPAYNPMAPPHGEPYTNFFSDENPNGCSIM